MRLYHLACECIFLLLLVPVIQSAAVEFSVPSPDQQVYSHCDAPRRIIYAWFLYSHAFGFPHLSHGFSPSPSTSISDAESENPLAVSLDHDHQSEQRIATNHQVPYTPSIHTFLHFRMRCNIAHSHIRSSNSTGLFSATDTVMEKLCRSAFHLSRNAQGGNPSIEPLLLLGEWYVLRGNLSAAHSTLLEAGSVHANATVAWNIGSQYEMSYHWSYVDSHRLVLLSLTRYYMGQFKQLDALYPEMYRNHFNEPKYVTLLQDRHVQGDLLRWQEKMGSSQIEQARKHLRDWKMYCHQPSSSSQHSCRDLFHTVEAAGISAGNAIDSDWQPHESVTDEELRTEFPNLLSFVQLQVGQPEREYEFDPLTPVLDEAGRNRSIDDGLRFYHSALIHFQASITSTRQVAFIVLNPNMRFTGVWRDHSVEFLHRLPAASEFDMALFDMDTLVLPQCAKMRDKGQHYWAQMLPGSIAIKSNAILVSQQGVNKLLLRRSVSQQQTPSQPLEATDSMLSSPSFLCHFGHEFTQADFVILYPIHPILMESYSPTPLTELIPSSLRIDRNGDGLKDARDVRVRLVLSKLALKPNQTELDIMHRLQLRNPFQMKSTSFHPSTFQRREHDGSSWFSIHSADEASLCLTENWSMGSPRWLRWSNQCAEVGVDFWWIIRTVRSPFTDETTQSTAAEPAPFDPNMQEAQYVTLEGSRGSFLFVQSERKEDGRESHDPFLRMREFRHSPPNQQPYNYAPPECSIFRIERGQIFTCFNTSLLTHPFYHSANENEKPVLVIAGAPLRNFSRSIIPAVHMAAESSANYSSVSIANVRFIPVFHPRKFEASLAHSYAQLPVRRIVWAVWTNGPESWPRLMKYNVISWHAILNGVDSSNATNREGNDYLGVNSTDRNRWEIRILNLVDDHEDHLFNYVDKTLLPPRFMELSATNQADVARQLLLMLYGGIWFDISVFLLKPPEWLVSDGPGIWNSFYLDDRYHTVPHGEEYFQGLEMWATGSGVHSYIVEQNFLAQARTMMDFPLSTAIWLHPTMRNIDFTEMNGDHNYFRMNLLIVKCLQDDPLTRALFVSHGNVREARSRTGGYHWMKPYITPWLTETNHDYRWDFESATKLLTDPQFHTKDRQAWVKDIVLHNHMIEIPTAMAWSFRHNILITTKTNLGYILRQPLQIRQKVAVAEAARKKAQMNQNKRNLRS